MSDERRLAGRMVAPALILMAGVAGYPVLYAIWLSLHQYSVITPGLSRFVGLGNYIEQLTSHAWWAAVGNTFVFTLISVPLELLAGVGMALLLNIAFRFRPLLRSIVLLPYAILTVVSAITWRTIFDPDLGLVSTMLGALGLTDTGVVWLGQSGYAMTVVILADVWKTAPFVALLVLAGLQVIPAELREASQLDGAGALRHFWNITLPLLWPAIALAMIFRTLDALRVFDLPFVLTRGAYGTETMSVLAYQTLRGNQLIGEGSAVSILTFAIVMLVSFLYIRFVGGNIRSVVKGGSR
ncbi:carbohydrate ABC transporter permease [Nonomuraea guangzhouensis]|uniref:Carbohydrate ABC transporter permease n=1 Tax=Nonomuraea guangzhouensis TaxID=1291555 RepID=A0ABW4GVG9_9ACTN|nr:sugar ABC transporter permease [Nonomuraea guangzhouensis]